MQQYKTPEYYHCVSDARFRDSVYEPEADTFLFLDALDADRERLRKLCPARCVEVGCGSGTVLTHLFMLLHLSTETGYTDAPPTVCLSLAALDGPRPAVPTEAYYAVDINPVALEATSVTWQTTLTKYARATCSAAPTGVTQLDRESDGEPSRTGAQGVQDTPATLFRYPARDAALLAKARRSGSEAGNSPEHGASALQSPFTLQLVEGDLLGALDEVVRPPASDPTRASAGDDGSHASTLFDVVLFNPPYVPTSMEELQDAVSQRDVITAAWCGGPRGRVVLDRFLDMLPRYLSRRGCCYLVLIKENDETDVRRKVQTVFRQYLHCCTGAGGTPPPSASDEDVVHMTAVARRYTGEHLSIHRISYEA